MADQPLIPPFGKKVHLKDYDPAYSGGLHNDDTSKGQIEADLKRLAELQNRLYADSKKSILIVLQAIDTGGKDGTISHVFRGMNPQGIQITAFKAPTSAELAHDFLWRVHPHTPGKGMISVFNRSHYEDVLIVRVHDLIPKAVWKARYDYINQFEEMLAANNTIVLKFFLYISKEEQKVRFESRIKDPEKNWKFASADLKEREYWDQYIDAFEDMLTQCNTKYAPWHIVPANKKWYRNLVVVRTLIEAMEKIDPQYPAPESDLSKIVVPD